MVCCSTFGYQKSRRRFLLCSAALAIWAFWFPEPLQAANLGRIVRRAADVADDVPVRRLDDVMEQTAKSRAGRELLEKLSGSKHLDDALEHSKALRKAMKEVLGSADGAVLKELDALPRATQEAALVMAHGGKRLKQAVPDLALRSRLIREGGAETLSALGRFDDLGDDLVRFDSALKAGKLPSPPGMRGVTVEDFGSFFHRQGERGHSFWQKYVRPHWKLWVGTTALAAVLLAPDEYLDKAGDLTREGLQKIGRLGGATLAGALAGAIEGAGEAAKEVVEETVSSIRRTFFTSLSGIIAAVLLVLVAMLLVPATRRVLVAVWRLPVTVWRQRPKTSPVKPAEGEHS